ncbi:MAG: flippase-like domain-containing protein [Bergeyella sp.]|nr:flippase-like domain-containing protein [Bergeyella sp.]
MTFLFRKKYFKILLTLSLPLLFSSLFLWLAVRGMDIKKVQIPLSKAKLSWIFLSSLFGILAYIIRALRWNLLLKPLGYKITFSNALWTLSLGYFMNLTLPRSGELARSTALYKVEKVPVDLSFGTIILERMIDLLSMAIFGILALIFRYKAAVSFFHLTMPSYSTKHTHNIISFSYTQLGLVIIFFAIIIFLYVNFRKKILPFLRGVLSGVLSFQKIQNKNKFLFWSVGIWICYYLAAYLVCFALPETANFSPMDGVFIIVIGTLGMLAPASGGIGAFHFALKTGISALFLSQHKDPALGSAVGLSYAFLSHGIQMIIVIVMGCISFPMLAKAKKVS